MYAGWRILQNISVFDVLPYKKSGTRNLFRLKTGRLLLPDISKRKTAGLQ